MKNDLSSGSVNVLWLFWILGSCLGCAFLAYSLFSSEDKSIFMPGPLSDGHHQLEGSCDSCHSDAFGGGPVLQESCISCHGDVRKKPFDTHPMAKFADPRNADLLNTIDVTQCVTCHVEHKPEFTLANGLTQPKDLCFHCHESVAVERPSHEGMGFETCATCHNYHDNRALYTDFLVKRLDDPANLDVQNLPAKEFSDVLDMLLAYPRETYPVEVLTVDRADFPADREIDASIVTQWAESGHAAMGANCSACHVQVPEASDGAASNELESIVAHWTDTPELDGCSGCHEMEARTFTQGKHGMRLAADLDPMTPGQARLPMHELVAHEQLTCNSCHTAHDYNVVEASVDACIGCHADEHTAEYKESKHYALWLAEVAGQAEPGSGVSCASCHMPRISMDVDDYNSRVVVNHNQSASFAPNSKMLRPVCLNCHGIEYSLDALSDRDLIDRNFQGEPATKHDSMSMARVLNEAHQKRKEGN